MPKSPAKIAADKVLHALAKRHTDDVFLTQVKTGPTQYGASLHIMDAVALKKSWANPRIVVYEVKVDRGDFLRDDKWRAYLPFGNEMYFACPTGLIQPEELSAEVGLIYYNPEKETTKYVRKAVWHPSDMAWNMLYYIIMCRTDSDRHPFFSDSREFWKRWAAQDEIDYALDRKVKGRIRRLVEDYTLLKRRVENNMDHDELERLKKALKDGGIDTEHWAWVKDLKARLKTGIPFGVEYALDSIERSAQQVRNALKALNGAADAQQADKEATA